MSEAEFDSYLSLLAKFLRLRSRQRADLADELRDHLDSRLEELLAAGKTREEAIAVALEEFGDAAVLATEFSRLASRRTRRFVMRCTAASAAVVAAVLLLSVALAPPGPNGVGPANVAAQGQPGPPTDALREAPSVGGVPAVTDEESIEQQAIATLDEKLGNPVAAEFGGPLRTAIEYIAEGIAADVLIAEEAATEAGVSLDDQVTLKLTHTKVAARTALKFILEPRGLTFVNRAGVIYVTTAELADELLVTKVYNVRDLLERSTTQSPGGIDGATGMPMMPGGGGNGGPSGHPGSLGAAAQQSISDLAAALAIAGTGQIGGGLGGGGMGGGFGGMGTPTPALTGAALELVDTIRSVTPGPWMETSGSGGSVTVFNGLLVVRQTEENHGEIRKLLDALREAGRQQPGGSVEVPKGDPQPDSPIGESPLGPGGPEVPQAAAWRDLGLRLASLSKEESESAVEGTKYRGGLKVTELQFDGPAAQAGIRDGDILVGLHQWETVTLDNIAWALKNLPRGQSVAVRHYVIRDRETRTGELKLASR